MGSIPMLSTNFERKFMTEEQKEILKNYLENNKLPPFPTDAPLEVVQNYFDQRGDMQDKLKGLLETFSINEKTQNLILDYCATKGYV